MSEVVPAASSAAPPPPTQARGAPTRTRPTRTGWWIGSLVVALALIVGLVWTAGGFEQRTDVRTTVAPGSTIETGPYVFTFTSATVQKTQNYQDEPVWSVVVSGTGRTSGDKTLSPDDQDVFLAKDPGSGVVLEPKAQEFGAETDRSVSGGSQFTPGLPAIPYRLKFEPPATAFEPGRTIQLAVFDLEWRDTSLLQSGDLRWARTDDFYRYELPLRRLADDPH